MKTITNEERKRLIDDIMMRHAMGEETLGTAIRRLRLEVTGLDQDTFATMCALSTKALYQIEKDKGNPTINTIDGILRKFGLRLGLCLAARTTYAPPLGQPQPVSRTPARGAKPRREQTGPLSGTATLRAAAKGKVEEGDKGPSE
ncbi:helix-turn-helix transcriptional regulator [Pseudomonas resinovorans]|uniref:helix-turn-helix domain-containing protein n=1 Tax=Metapseudomonas resinovorans TaxID=53412 RepID=UPI00237F8CDE|nr:helix-turn-helix transcriptional regulator [Pseudomonas resinovorans]MDE3737808.1 helix-turn-helix transcriptional regulator [Pseudomonas resinovorans]